MRTISAVLVTLFLIAACGDDAPPPPPVDSGRRDTGATDAMTDSTVMDSTVLDGMTDSTAADSTVTDSTVTDSRVRDTGPGCGSDRCTCPMMGIDCGGGCPTGTTCLENTCGQMYCFRAGAECDSDADCPSTSTCTMTMLGGACITSLASCADSRDCPDGHACEGGMCIDRRVPCINNVDCPWGYVCNVGPTSAGSYCDYIARACDDPDVCSSLGDCRDYDGDGDTECGGLGACPLGMACTGGDACGTHPRTFTASCGDYGPCQATCNSGFSCVDEWGDGQGQCMPTGGTCTSNTDCPVRQVCAPPNGGGAPACQMGNDG